jgi:hypothetical protein
MRISHSACNTYIECPRKYFLHYFLKLRSTEQRSALAFGGSIDEALNVLLLTRDLNASMMRFESEWLKFKDIDIAYSKADLDSFLVEDCDEATSVKDRTWLSLLRKGRILLDAYATQILPRIKEVIKIQLDQLASNGSGDELIIKTDMIVVWEDGRRILFDNKTSSIKYADDSVATSPQLGIYYETLKAEYRLDACGYIVIPKRIRKTKLPQAEIVVIIDQVSEESINKTLQSFDDVLVSIKSAEFPCNMDSCTNVFGRCQYYNYCRSGDRSNLKEKV